MAEEDRRNRKKIVLVNITRPFRGAELELHAPLALMYLSQALKDVGFDTAVKDITPEEFNESVARILPMNPLFVGVSCTFGTYSTSFVEYSKRIKEINPEIPIVWGGGCMLLLYRS